LAIDPTRPIRPATPYAGRKRETEERLGDRFDTARERSEARRPPPVDREPAVEIDGSLFEHLQQIAEAEGIPPGAAAYGAEESPWDIAATVRLLALDLDLLMTNLFGLDESAAHDIGLAVTEAFGREIALWHAQPVHHYLTTKATVLYMAGDGAASIRVGEKALEVGDATVLEGVPIDRCRPGLHHYGDSHYWVRIESVIHEMRARLGHIDFRRMSARRTEAGASRGLRSAVMLSANGSRRGMREEEKTKLVLDTVTPLVARSDPDARPGAVRVEV